MKIQSFALAAGLMLASSVSAFALSPGDWVLGNWQGAGYWYPGIVEKVGDGKVTVVYDDGDKETVAVGNVKAYDWKIGKKVECNFKGSGEWYAGKITALGGENISIAYDDGDKENTKTGRCRSN